MADFVKLNGYNVKDAYIHETLKASFLSRSSTDIGACNVIYTDNVCIIADLGIENDCTTLRSFLSNNNITKIDAIIISHYHLDHIGGDLALGLSALLNDNSLDFTNTIAYLPHNLIDYSRCTLPEDDTYQSNAAAVLNILNNNNITINYPTENYTVEFDNISIVFNNLLTNYFNYYYAVLEGGYTNFNNFSMITTINHLNNKITLPADIQYEAEEMNFKIFSNTNLLQVPHHNVNDIAYIDFIDILKPEFAVINLREAENIKYTPVTNRLVDIGCIVTDTWTTNTPTFISTYEGIDSYQDLTPSNIQYLQTGLLTVVDAANALSISRENIDDIRYKSICAISPSTLGNPGNIYGMLITFGQMRIVGARWIWQYIISTDNTLVMRRYWNGENWNAWKVYSQKTRTALTLDSTRVLSGNIYYQIKAGMCHVYFDNVTFTAQSWGAQSSETQIATGLPTFTYGYDFLVQPFSADAPARLRITGNGELRFHYTNTTNNQYYGYFCYPID